MENETGAEAPEEASLSWDLVFENHLIMESVIKHLNKADLENVRLVNSSWRSSVTAMLQRKHLWKVRIRPRSTVQELVSVVATETFPGVVQEWNFEELLVFELMIGSNRTRMDARLHALRAIGERVGKFARVMDIRFGYRNGYTSKQPSPSKLLESVLCNATNLVELSLFLCGCPLSDGEHDMGLALEFDAIKVSLPNLRELTLDIGTSCEEEITSVFTSSLLNAAPTLETIKVINVDILNTFISCKKVAHVKELWCDVGSPTTRRVKMLKKFVASVPALHTFYFVIVPFPDFNAQNKEVANILLTYQKTLRKMGAQCTDFVEKMTKKPVFENLTFLEVSGFGSALIGGPSTASCFPVLKEVKLRNLNLQQTFATTIAAQRVNPKAESYPKIPSVSKLEIQQGWYEEPEIELIAKIFPNVKEVTITQAVFSRNIPFADFWKLPATVENLTFKLIITDFRAKIADLDEFLTGESKERLRGMQPFGVQFLSAPFHEHPSALKRGIHRLTGLKTFKLIFDVDEVSLMRSPPTFTNKEKYENSLWPFFMHEDSISVMSALFAFDREGLQATISFDGRLHCAQQIYNKLEPLLGFVAFDETFKSNIFPDIHYYFSSMEERVEVVP